MNIKIISYNKIDNSCVGNTDTGITIKIDPFVGCAITMNDDQYENNYGFSLVGKEYNIVDNCYKGKDGTWLPSEKEMIEIKTDISLMFFKEVAQAFAKITPYSSPSDLGVELQQIGEKYKDLLV